MIGRFQSEISDFDTHQSKDWKVLQYDKQVLLENFVLNIFVFTSGIYNFAIDSNHKNHKVNIAIFYFFIHGSCLLGMIYLISKPFRTVSIAFFILNFISNVFIFQMFMSDTSNETLILLPFSLIIINAAGLMNMEKSIYVLLNFLFIYIRFQSENAFSLVALFSTFVVILCDFLKYLQVFSKFCSINNNNNNISNNKSNQNQEMDIQRTHSSEYELEECFFKGLLDLTSQGIAVFNFQNEIIFSNQEIRQILNCTETQIIDKLRLLSDNSQVNHSVNNNSGMTSPPPHPISPGGFLIHPGAYVNSDRMIPEMKLKQSVSFIENDIHSLNVSLTTPQKKQNDIDINTPSRKKGSFDLNSPGQDFQRKSIKRLSNCFPNNIDISQLKGDKCIDIAQIMKELLKISCIEPESDSKSYVKSNSSQFEKQIQSKIGNLKILNDEIDFEVRQDKLTFRIRLVLCCLNEGNSNLIHKRKNSSTSIYEEDQKSVLLIIEDITQQKYLIQLKETNKIKVQMLASFSHELRTPLNGSISLLEILHNQMLKTSPLLDSKFLLPALKSNILLTNIINDILDFSQLEFGLFEYRYSQFNLVSLIIEITDLFKEQIQIQGLEVIKVFDNKMPFQIINDRQRTKQVLLNIINNAIKFTRKGHIKIQVSYDYSLSEIQIKVQDTGIGIPKKNKDFIFNLFGGNIAQINENMNLNSQGAGLGLTISSKIAQGLTDNGRIQLVSEVGIGSQFSFQIKDFRDDPKIESQMRNQINSIQASDINDLRVSGNNFRPERVYDSNSLLKSTSDLKNSISNRSSISQDENYENIKTLILEEQKTQEQCKCSKILITDDNQFNIYALLLIIQSLGQSADYAMSGQEAIDKVRLRLQNSCCNTYQLILMDLDMPGMNGYETTSEILKLLKRLELSNEIQEVTQIVACTAFVGEEQRTHCHQIGMCGFLGKPVQLLEISNTLSIYKIL